jgi:aminoglycoside phosphotransferase (APT) family kinase protein
MPAAVWTPEVHIDLARATQVLERDHPDLASLPLSVLGEGWDNLAVSVGDQWVFRFARRELAARLMNQEIRWSGELARALDVPIPVPARTGTLSPDKPFPYMGHRMLPGTTACRAGLSSLPHRALAVRLGGLLARLHSLPVPADAPRDTIGRGDHLKRGNRALSRLAEVDEARLAQDRPAIHALLSAPPHTGPLCWVHGDLYARHLLLDEQRQLCGIIDWGDVHAGDPAIDLSIAWSLLCGEAREALLRAYQEGGRPVDEALCSRARLVAYDYAGALIPYGRALQDEAATQLGLHAWQMAGAP